MPACSYCGCTADAEIAAEIFGGDLAANFQIIGAIAEFEHALMSERTMDGLATARALSPRAASRRLDETTASRR